MSYHTVGKNSLVSYNRTQFISEYRRAQTTAIIAIVAVVFFLCVYPLSIGNYRSGKGGMEKGKYQKNYVLCLPSIILFLMISFCLREETQVQHR